MRLDQFVWLVKSAKMGSKQLVWLVNLAKVGSNAKSV